jgi:hypothetical protein
MEPTRVPMTVVISSNKTGWDIKPSVDTYPLEHFVHIQDAIDRARQISKLENTELVICFTVGTDQPKALPQQEPEQITTPNATKLAILIIPNFLEGWDIIDEETSQSFAHCAKQTEALEQARDICDRMNYDAFILVGAERIPIKDFEETL